MLVVGRERRGHRDAERHLADLDVDPEAAEHGVQAPVELRDVEPVVQAERLAAPAGGADHHGVVDEVERDVEAGAPVAERPGGESADIDVERDVPPMVVRCRRGQPNLPDDLAVELKRHFDGVERVFFERLTEEDIETLARVFEAFRR